MQKHPQHPLPLKLQTAFSFKTFDATNNEESVSLLQKLAQGDKNYPIWYCWGKPSSGKTHLIQAVCEQANSNKLSYFYLNLNAKESNVELLNGLEFFDLVCLDGLDSVAESQDWQLAIFNLINRMMASKKILLISAQKNTKDHNLSLPDLASRLAWGINLHINHTPPEQLNALVCLKAEQIGFNLKEEVARYLSNYFSSDLKKLVGLLGTLNEAALSEKKKLISISFVKKVLAD
jgi:DnaA family protein